MTIPQAKGMVDTSQKAVTARKAIASAEIKLGKKAFTALIKNQSPKGNVLETAKVAGIMAAKNTPAIIPMCHPLELNKATISYKMKKSSSLIMIKAEVVYVGRTGVEMEALTAVTACALTIYDMMKWADKGMTIRHIKLLYKSGGKSGVYDRT